MTGKPCSYCNAAPGEKCAIKRKHQRGWRAPCVIEFEAAEAALAQVWRESLERDAEKAREIEVRVARLEKSRRRQRDARAYVTLGLMAIAAIAWLAICVRHGWVQLP